jgi:DNA-binding NarL/FixJ family response regulator
MSSGAHDLIGLVEALYTPDIPDERWLQIVVQKLQPVLDQHRLGITGGMYSCPDPCSFTVTRALMCDVPESIQGAFFEGMKSLSPDFVAHAFLNQVVSLGSDLRGWGDISTNRNGASPAVGVVDSLTMNVVEPDGEGCWFVSARSQRQPILNEQYLTLTRFARHLAAAHRLRRRHPHVRVSADEAEAVVDPTGHLEHAAGPAKDADNQVALVRAVRAMDAARSRKAGSDQQGAISRWKSVVLERWTMLDHFEKDGKRFVLAMENRPKPPSLGLLSSREHQVVARALAGLENKAIAADLGLAPSTIRVPLARAAAKVGVRSRRELLYRAANLGASRPQARNGAQRGE